MWLWFCLIAGIILGLVLVLGELVMPVSYETNEIEVETIIARISLDELLEEWDLQDHLEELEEEE